jgi:hypothetical protein
MVKFEPLPREQSAAILESLTEDQRNFLADKSKQDKKSRWLESLARFKGVVVDAGMDEDEIIRQINDWVLIDVLDGGRFSRSYRCECGKTLRFQYIVHHMGRGITYKLGSSCFENYTKLPPEVLKDIQDGFYHIDLERDEILTKYQRGERFDLSPHLHLNIPNHIKSQVLIGLPLSDRQIATIKALHEKRASEEKAKHEYQRQFQGTREQLNMTEDNLTGDQKEWIGRLNNLERIELLRKLRTGSKSYPLDYLQEIGVHPDIIRHVELGLPLLKSQLFEIERKSGRGFGR